MYTSEDIIALSPDQGVVGAQNLQYLLLKISLSSLQ